MTSCGHSFCFECIKPFGERLESCEDWNCPLCQTSQLDSPKETSRNYALEQVLQRKFYEQVLRREITDQQLKINELIEKQPDQFKGDILRREFFFQLTLRKFFRY